MEVRQQQIGQLELLAAAAAYYTLATWLRERDVLHFIDNTAAVCGIAKGYSSKCDSARITCIHTYHALNVDVQAQVHFEWVASEANIADSCPRAGSLSYLPNLAAVRSRCVCRRSLTGCRQRRRCAPQEALRCAAVAVAAESGTHIRYNHSVGLDYYFIIP